MIDEDLDNFCFEYIKEAKDLILPIRYSMFIYDPSKEEIIRLNKLMIDKFYYNKDFNSLINQTFIDVDIPIDILVKYWLRAYTLNCYFYEFLNQELKSGIEDYDLYTRMVYYGLKNKSIDFLTDKPLYRGSIIFNEEVKVIENNLKIKKKKLMNNAYQFMIRKKIDDSKSFCFYSIDIPNQSALKDMIISNADLEKLSYYQDEKEILFFPFSCFEIEKIENNENKYTITLNYLSGEIFINQNHNLSNASENDYQKSICNSGLIDKIPSNDNNSSGSSITTTNNINTNTTAKKYNNSINNGYANNKLNNNYANNNINSSINSIKSISSSYYVKSHLSTRQPISDTVLMSLVFEECNSAINENMSIINDFENLKKKIQEKLNALNQGNWYVSVREQIMNEFGTIDKNSMMIFASNNLSKTFFIHVANI